LGWGIFEVAPIFFSKQKKIKSMRILIIPALLVGLTANAQINANVDTSYIQKTFMDDMGIVRMLMCNLSLENGIKTKVLISPDSQLKKGDCVVFYHDLDNPRHVLVNKRRWYCFLNNELKRK